jgi:diguanylate cyclase (GGDEF)-like protein
MDDQRRTIALSAAAIYAGAAVIGVVEELVPGGQKVSVAPGFAAVVVAPLVALFGPRLPRLALAALGPLGTAMIAFALATTTGYGDGAVLYLWPVLWMAYFFGTPGAAVISAWTGLCHGLALLWMPPGVGSLDRWIDVVVTVVVVAAVARSLAARNDRLVAELFAESRADALTGLLNRRGFDERLEVEFARVRRDGGVLAAVAIDIDHFKAVNDAYGHDAGDHALAGLGARIAAEVRAADIAARVGGEEFVVVLPGAGEDAAFAFAERLRKRVEAATDEPALTISCGVAVTTAEGDEQTLYDAADQALYTAKRTGRNRTVLAAGRVAA